MVSGFRTYILYIHFIYGMRGRIKIFLGILAIKKVRKHRTDFSPFCFLVKKVLVTTWIYFIGIDCISITISIFTFFPENFISYFFILDIYKCPFSKSWPISFLGICYWKTIDFYKEYFISINGKAPELSKWLHKLIYKNLYLYIYI